MSAAPIDAQKPTPEHYLLNGHPYLCAYAKSSPREKTPLPIYNHYKGSKIIGRIDKGDPIYICDEWGEWSEVHFGGPCSKLHAEGIRSNFVTSCKMGWILTKKLIQISG